MNYEFISAFIQPENGIALVRFSLADNIFTIHKTEEIGHVPAYSRIESEISKLAAIANPQNQPFTILSNFPSSLKTHLVNHLKIDSGFYIRSISIEEGEALTLLQSCMFGSRLNISESANAAFSFAMMLKGKVLQPDEPKPLLLNALYGISWVESRLIGDNLKVA